MFTFIRSGNWSIIKYLRKYLLMKVLIKLNYYNNKSIKSSSYLAPLTYTQNIIVKTGIYTKLLNLPQAIIVYIDI